MPAPDVVPPPARAARTADPYAPLVAPLPTETPWAIVVPDGFVRSADAVFRHRDGFPALERNVLDPHHTALREWRASSARLDGPTMAPRALAEALQDFLVHVEGRLPGFRPSKRLVGDHEWLAAALVLARRGFIPAGTAQAAEYLVPVARRRVRPGRLVPTAAAAVLLSASDCPPDLVRELAVVHGADLDVAAAVHHPNATAGVFDVWVQWFADDDRRLHPTDPAFKIVWTMTGHAPALMNPARVRAVLAAIASYPGQRPLFLRRLFAHAPLAVVPEIWTALASGPDSVAVRAFTLQDALDRAGSDADAVARLACLTPRDLAPLLRSRTERHRELATRALAFVGVVDAVPTPALPGTGSRRRG